MLPHQLPFINLEYVYYSLLKTVFGNFEGSVFILIYEKIANLAEWLVPYSVFLSLFLLAFAIYCFLRIKQVEKLLRAEKTTVSTMATASSKKINTRWERILAHINSESENDWRLAIIEADVILEEMLTSMGYHGETIGEQLQGIEKSDFKTLDDAWEAHKVRNKIAHEGGDFALSKREAKRVISLFENVFAEFKFI